MPINTLRIQKCYLEQKYQKPQVIRAMNDKTLISFDFAIKYMLRDKGDYDIVEGFISALLKAAGYGAVKIKALLESETNKEQLELKQAIADLIVEDEQHNK